MDQDSITDDHKAKQESPIFLDYGRAERPKYFFTQPLGIMIWISLGWLMLIEMFYAARLDGGLTGRRVSETWLGYLFVTAIILLRRARKFTKTDLAFIGFGYPLLVLITESFVLS